MANYSYSLDIGKDLEKDLDKKPLKEVVNETNNIQKESEKINNQEAQLDNNTNKDIQISVEELSRKLEDVEQPEIIKNKSKTNIFSYLFSYKTLFLLIIILIIGFFVFNNKNSNEIITEKNLNENNIIINEISNKINPELQQDNLLKQVLIDGLKDDR